MKRLTFVEQPYTANRSLNCARCPMLTKCNCASDCVDSAVNRLAHIEDILGDDYDLSRLRDLVQADREGRCVVLSAGDFSDQDGENALKSAMNTCYYHNNPVTRFIADAVAEKLVRAEAALKERENNG